MSGAEECAGAAKSVPGFHTAAALVPPVTGALCQNCGTALRGEHCHHCGQGAHVHRTLASIGHDIAHGVFHFEGRIWRTLPLLVLRPGELTRRYIAGERARFVSPLALFLFTVFAMFAIYSFVGPADIGADMGRGMANAELGLAQGRESTRARITGLERQRQAAVAARRDTRPIDAKLAERRNDLAAIDGVQRRLAVDRGGSVNSDIPWLNRAIAKLRENPGLVVYKVQSSAYKYSWSLILLSIPFVALLFLWRRGYGLYDHAIFVTYSITFMSLLVIAVELLLSIGASGGLIGLLAIVAPPLHMFVQLRGAYRLSVLSAAWRTVALVFFASVILIVFVLALVGLSVAH